MVLNVHCGKPGALGVIDQRIATLVEDVAADLFLDERVELIGWAQQTAPAGLGSLLVLRCPCSRPDVLADRCQRFLVVAFRAQRFTELAAERVVFLGDDRHP